MIFLFMEWITVLQNRFIQRLRGDLHLKELLTGSSIALVMRLSGALLGYAFTLLITHQYGAEGMGIFALSLTVLNVGTILGKFGLDTTVMRLIANSAGRGRWDEVLWTHQLIRRWGMVIAAGVSILLWITTPIIAEDMFHKPFLTPYFRWATLAIFPLTLFYIFSESLRGLKRVKEYVFLQFIHLSLFGGAVLSILSLLGVEQPGAPLYAYLTAVVVGSGGAYLLWRRALPEIVPHSHQFYPEINSPKILRIASHMLISGSILLVMGWIDRIMLGMYTSEAQVGIYAVALRVAALGAIPLFAINSIASPKFAEMKGQNDFSGLNRVVRHSARLIFWITLPIVAVFMLFPHFILHMFGAEFVAGIPVLLLLSTGRIVSASCGSIGSIMQMVGMEKVLNVILLIAAILNVILNALLIPRYDISGAAFASMLSIVFWHFGAMLYARKSPGVVSFYLPGFGKKR